jgi:hypothetical protein
MVSPRPDGGAILPPADEEVVLRFGGTAVTRRIDVAAAPRVLDLHMSVDTTASMTGEIDELQQSLRTQVMPMLRAQVADVSFGASRFEDFPSPPFGTPANGGIPADTPFVLLSPITSDESRVVSAIAALDHPLGAGGDLPEAGAEALYQIATGDGYSYDGAEIIAPFARQAATGGGRIGGVGFRDGALRAVLHVTDAPAHSPDDYTDVFPGTHDLDQAGEALKAIDARLIGIVSACGGGDKSCVPAESELARRQLEHLATITGAVVDAQDGSCPFGVGGGELPAENGHCPLVFDITPDGRGLSNTLIDAVASLLDGTRFHVVSAFAAEDPIGFVASVEPVEPSLTPGTKSPAIDDLLPRDHPDGQPDSFVEVAAKSPIAFELVLRNQAIASSDVDQHFRVVVEVRGDELLLERRTIRIVIPAGDRLAPPRDAGGEPDAG